VGAEALLRWHHPQRGLVLPAEFIHLAEETGAIVPIGAWVLRVACAQMKRWAQQASTRHLTLAVNVSALQFGRDDFVSVVQQALLETGINPALLEIEVTESMMLDAEHAVLTMQALRAMGVQFAVDDFGTGYSSLAHLTRLPISTLKIDQSFVRNMALQPADLVIVQTIVGMAHSLGLRVVAEGVETPAQLAQLQACGCNLFQGHLFGQAQPVAVFEELLLNSAHQRLHAWLASPSP
jgi:EAL domain-containing protein (putative c-di-GMP-specific phosphodiesterase class I)